MGVCFQAVACVLDRLVIACIGADVCISVHRAPLRREAHHTRSHELGTLWCIGRLLRFPGVWEERNIVFSANRRPSACPRSSMGAIHMTPHTSIRVTFERDEGQDYPVGTRVTAHAMDVAYRTLALDPSSGKYVVARCERIRDVGWRGLRVSLALAGSPTSSQVPTGDRVSAPSEVRAARSPQRARPRTRSAWPTTERHST